MTKGEILVGSPMSGVRARMGFERQLNRKGAAVRGYVAGRAIQPIVSEPLMDAPEVVGDSEQGGQLESGPMEDVTLDS